MKILRQGQEQKIQLETVQNYRKVQAFLTTTEIPHYTYQLKSARSIRAVIKGIDQRIEPQKIIPELKKIGETKKLLLIIQLEPAAVKINPIFDLKRFIHMMKRPKNTVLRYFRSRMKSDSKVYCKRYRKIYQQYIITSCDLT